MVLFDGQGRAYTVRASDLPGGRSDGVPVTSLIDLQNGKVTAMLSGPPETRVLLATTSGVGFIGVLGDMTARTRAGKAYMNVDEGAALIPPTEVSPGTRHIAALSEEPRLLIFPMDEMKFLSGGKGVILMALNPGEKLLAARAVADRVRVTGIGRGDRVVEYEVAEKGFEPFLGRRARKGKGLPVKMKKAGGLG